MTSRRLFWILFVGLCVAGTWARSAHFRSVFVAGEVELVPADSHYYLRFARLQQASFPRYTRQDPYVNHPEGASILWPPLHALGLAAWLAPFPASAHERQAATFAPVLALLELAAVVLLARRLLGPRAALVAGAVLALTPAIVETGALGTADHHVHEPFVVAAVTLAFARALRTGDRHWALTTGVLVGAARLLTTSSFFLLPVLAAAAVVAALRWRAGAARVGQALEWTGAAAAGVLLASAILFGEPLSLRYETLSAFHPLLALGTLGVAGALAFLTARRREGIPMALAGAVALAVVTPEALRAAGHLGRADPLLSVVVESGSLIADPTWALRLLGPTAVILLVGLWAGVRALGRGAERAAGVELLPAFWATLALLAMAALQARFAPALGGAAAVLIASTGPREAVWPRGWKLAAAAALVAAVPVLWPPGAVPPPADVRSVRPTLRWMREHLPPASSNPYDASERPAWAVLANHQLGHFITLWAERPAIASTFSQRPVHQAANERAAAVLASTSDEGAFTLARDTGARFLLVTPIDVLLGQPGFDRVRSTLTHLLDDAGMETAVRPATGHFRWRHDSREQRERGAGGSYARLFEVVPGATLEGTAPPGTPVVATSEVRVGDGPRPYRVRGAAGPTGAYQLVVAYPAAYEVRVGEVAVEVSVEEDHVSTGARIAVAPPRP